MNDNLWYQALRSRDIRFDGLFFVGVTTTGIYCRPICTARTPKKQHCRFFSHAAAAESEYFRPCLRCRPEIAPAYTPWNAHQNLAYQLAQSIRENFLNKDHSLDDLASEFNLSTRHLRRILVKEWGVSPVQLAQTYRLLLAKQLLSQTNLPIIDIAYASGFSSLRRFNHVLKTHYHLTPTQLRKNLEPQKIQTHGFKLSLGYRPPLAWQQLLQFLSHRAIKGIEYVDDQSYKRTLDIDGHKGWVHVTHAPNGYYLDVEISFSLLPVLSKTLNLLRDFFDLRARPDIINAYLNQDKRLAKIIQKYPGVRVPGTLNIFELMWRAVLGQKISVKAATTLASRLVEKFGSKFTTPFQELVQLSPDPKILKTCEPDHLADLGIGFPKAKIIIELAKLCANDETHSFKFNNLSNSEIFIERILKISGIGPWTAHYIAMRAFRWPDAFLRDDLIVCRMAGATAKQLEKLSEVWRPWRAYAVMYFWLLAAEPDLVSKN
ncbi:MAG: helix-turn-helix domain-containing protein [Alphaproteobacteria bacterium]|nr:helix-turn-helix domain-containing protein [Alphaproteobacteria bacterium]